jgi:hypothetical protein
LGPALTSTFPFGDRHCAAMTEKIVGLVCR